MAPGKKRVAVLFGGRSAEHEISIITGLEAAAAIDTERYEVLLVYIEPRGRWFTGEALQNKEFYKRLPESFSEVKEVTLLPLPGVGGLTVRSSGGKLKQLLSSGDDHIPVDIFMPIFHGQFGEDGCIQGLFEMADVAYTGAGVLASAVAMNKYLCKAVAQAHGVPVLPGVIVRKEEAQRSLAAVRDRILSQPELAKFPLFVKPVNLGSSVAVGRAEDQAGLDGALAKVFEHDYAALVEPCISSLLEVNVSVLEDEREGCIASVTEVPVASKGVLTFEDKYLRGGKGKGGSKSSGQRLEGMAGLTRVIDPEDLDPAIKQAVSNHAATLYRALASGGCARFDFMVDTATGSLYFNELNPIPGSMAYYLWEKSNPRVLYPDILNRMLDGALRRKQ
ncbi:MAG: hypothetical protein KDD69_17765, partial [Bdellovibrionales bacterium]|nr:hypothetical protein [Bdellovibrionales bacterium]